jgi:hypothetical protein
VKKKPYAPPALEVLGSLAELTLGDENPVPDTTVIGSGV